MLDNEIVRTILIILLVALLLWFLYKFITNWKKDERVKNTTRSAVGGTHQRAASTPSKKPMAAAAATKPAARPKKDDLTKIEGIGPKINQLLNAAGIYSFGQLANAPVSKLKKVLENAGSRFAMHDPGTWPQQAQLASKGDWSALERLQDRLNAGK